MTNGQRLAFDANYGGTVLPTSPVSIAAPVTGFGWSSSFGWLALNCASVPLPTGSLATDVCNPDNKLYGAGVSIASSLLPTPSAPVDPFSPSTVSTFPVGGYAFSDNIGFLSFNRANTGNPPGEGYHANAEATDPIIKYDKSTQKLNGWGRFWSLCNFNTTTGACDSPTGGWVRFRGYWTNLGTGTKTAHFTSATAATIENTDCTTYQAGNILQAGQEYLIVNSGCVANSINPSNIDITTQTSLHNFTGSPTNLQTQVVKNGTTINQEYGVDAFWNGSSYEFSGWAWSDDFGWIRFNPLIFIGFAWMETLFGNIYSGGDITLPDPVTPSGERVSTCGANGTDPCYTATYRIETNGNISGITYLATRQGAPAATSATPTISPQRIYPDTFDPAGLLQQSNGRVIPFPTVSNATTIYRNLLGKIDLQALLTLTQSTTSYADIDGTIPADSHDINVGPNRLGNTVYDMQSSAASNPDWKVSELVSKDLSTNAEVTAYAMDTQRSQVIHIPGNLTVDGASATLASDFTSPVSSVSVNSVAGTFPVCPTVPGTESYTSCAFVVNPGASNEEYFAYTGFSGSQLTGVTLISAGPAKPHNNGEPVRWTWRLPYQTVSLVPQTTTIVVDGNLDIQYNIIATTPTAGLTKVTDVPTIAFIVKGNVKVEPEVTHVVGAFVVLSKQTVNTSGLPVSADTTFEGTNGGSFFTSSDQSACDMTSDTKLCRPLTIEGLIFARSFSLQRYGSLSLQVPGEKIIFDERLFLNPPPGLEDVAKSLPNPERQLP